MIYELQTLMQGLGGADATRAAFDWFREATVKAGLLGCSLPMVDQDPPYIMARCLSGAYAP
jgi:hypothetical protein